MATRNLPQNPSLRSLKNQAKQLLSDHRSGEAEACERFRAAHPSMRDVTLDALRETRLVLADAQLVVAREYGFDSWQLLLVEVTTEEAYRNANGWEWILVPDSEHRRLGTRGSMGGECMLMYENKDHNNGVMVYFSIGPELIDRECRPVGFDDKGRRYDFDPVGNVTSKTRGLFGFELAYSELDRPLISLGIEARCERQ